MVKKQRQDKIIEIISSNEITTQEMLKKYLEDIGIDVTQATLSRDINELNLKKESNGVYKYTVPLKNLIECPAILKDSVIDVLYAMNTVVIKCHTGMAQAACATIDKMEYTDIVGTIAGDDTIFVLMPDEKSAAALCGNLRDMIL
ncbi:MAG: ArgR family transcriptional regulator [Oscillospiraceae bacterium]|nr:ArgR family transcriptional regulator [Oscillospiraceae bacterium]